MEMNERARSHTARADAFEISARPIGATSTRIDSVMAVRWRIGLGRPDHPDRHVST